MLARPIRHGLLVLLALVAATPFTTAAQQDPMEPTSQASAAFAAPLAAITIATSDLTATRRFYQGALGMSPAFSEASGEAARELIRHWNLPRMERVSIVTFTRPGVPEAITVRAIEVPATLPSNRLEHGGDIEGPLGMGVPVRGLARRGEIAEALGFTSVVGITSMQFPRADGTSYPVGEVHYRAPDDVLVLGVDRADMRPVGPIDPAIDIGGPAYASMIISDAAAFEPLFGGVLGYERRREFTFRSRGTQGGMRLPDGIDVRFQQWFAPGARTGYLVIMDLTNGGRPAPAGLDPHKRGIVAWTFEVPDLAEAAKRAAAARVTVLRPAATVAWPGGARYRSMLVATPDGFTVELVERGRQAATYVPD